MTAQQSDSALSLLDGFARCYLFRSWSSLSVPSGPFSIVRWRMHETPPARQPPPETSSRSRWRSPTITRPMVAFRRPTSPTGMANPCIAGEF